MPRIRVNGPLHKGPMADGFLPSVASSRPSPAPSMPQHFRKQLTHVLHTLHAQNPLGAHVRGVQSADERFRVSVVLAVNFTFTFRFDAVCAQFTQSCLQWVPYDIPDTYECIIRAFYWLHNGPLTALLTVNFTFTFIFDAVCE